MAYSDPTYDEIIQEFLTKNKFERYLDIGPGAGKYGKMLREINLSAYLEAIEADASYISKYGLEELYDKVHSMRVEDFYGNRPAYTTDIVTIGDCLEHLKKSGGIDLIHYLVYRARYIIIVFPSKYVQYDYAGHDTEAHMSVWDESDFQQFECKFSKSGYMNLAIIKGYIGDPDAVFPMTPEETGLLV